MSVIIRNKLYYENRLMNNGKDNAKVIKKIYRKLRLLERGA